MIVTMQAIAKAASWAPRCGLRGGKMVKQQDVQALLKICDRLVKSGTGLINEIRGLLQEYRLRIADAAKRVYMRSWC